MIKRACIFTNGKNTHLASKNMKFYGDCIIPRFCGYVNKNIIQSRYEFIRILSDILIFSEKYCILNCAKSDEK